MNQLRFDDYINKRRSNFDLALETTRKKIAERIAHVIKRNEMTHAVAAEVTGFGRTVITAVVGGNIDKISTDRLLKIAERLDLKIQIKVW